MKQVVQNIRSGVTAVQLLPDPIATPGHVVVANSYSLISAGTERYVVELAGKSLLGKARSRPDHVRRVLQKLQQEGLIATATQVFAKLNEPMPLGYSTAGVVLECGAGVQNFKPGDRVATAGPHAGVVCVGRNLCAPVPAEVGLEDAAYAAVGAIALQGLRLAHLTLGARVVVIGLGLVGQITVCLAKAQGCHVFGVDVDSAKLAQARALGADAVATAAGPAFTAFCGAHGVDAAIITAATESNGPVELGAHACRRGGRVVQVGATGLNLPRAAFFEKELSLVVSSSLGAGRGDLAYEEKGIDYPIAHARWTAQRNMVTVLEAMQTGALPVHKLTSHRYTIDDAAAAYDLITSRREPFLGILLQYPTPRPTFKRRVSLPSGAPVRPGQLGVSLVGAGNFARLVMTPELGKLSGVRLRGLASARGLNALSLGSQYHFSFVSTDADEILHDPHTHAVCIFTRHHAHAELVLRALRAGKHVFVEKPLCITASQLVEIDACVAELGARCPILMVGFNRRFAPATALLRQHFAGAGPLSLSYRFACGAIPADAWPQDEAVGGGRIVGEACHALDLCTALAGAEVVRVFAESVGAGHLQTTDDRVFISARHANGSIAQISYQAGGDQAGPTERLEIFGGGRSATLEGWDKLTLWANNRARRHRLGHDKGHRAEIARFVQACQHGGAWPIAWGDLHNATWASLAAVASLRTGFPVDLHDPGADSPERSPLRVATGG